MRCKYCNAQIPENPRRGRCPDCGASVMTKPKRQINWIGLMFFGIILLGGVIFILGGILDGVVFYSNQDYYTEVEAVIEEIRKETTYDSINEKYDTDYTVLVSYSYDGVDYMGVELNYYNSTMKVGDLRRVKIDIRNPGKPVTNELWLVIPGLIFVAAGGFLWFVFTRNQGKRKANSGR